MKFKDYLKSIHACSEALEWVEDRTIEQAWQECERGDWLLRLAKKAGVDIKTLTLAKVRCARLVEHLMTDERSKQALDVAERFAAGEATREELDKAARAAYAAAAAAAAAYADDAADTAADACAHAAAAYAAAYAAADAAYAAAVAAAAYGAYADDAADTAADAYADAVADAAREETLKKCADICREVIDVNLIEDAINEHI